MAAIELGQILYAKAGVTPRQWRRVQVLDAMTGEVIPRVFEANATEGWIEQRVVDERGRGVREGDNWVNERVERPIRLVLMALTGEAAP